MKVLVSAFNHYGYLQSIARGFREVGCETRTFEHVNATIMDWDCPSMMRRWRRRRRLRSINQRFVETVRRFSPEVVFFVNGEPFFPSVLQGLRKQGVRLAIRAADAICNVRRPTDSWNDFDLVVVFEPTDLNSLERCHAVYIPCGFDPHVYHVLENAGEVFAFDTVFVGGPHPERLPVLEQIAEFSARKGLRFGVAGPGYFKSRGTGGVKFCKAFPYLANCIIHDGPLAPQDVNQLYNRSRSALNIHHVQNREGINIRTFEIPASGTVELVDWHSRIDNFFRVGEEIVCYRNVQELCGWIVDLRHNDELRHEIASRGLVRVRKDHTMAHRCREILDMIQ